MSRPSDSRFDLSGLRVYVRLIAEGRGDILTISFIPPCDLHPLVWFCCLTRLRRGTRRSRLDDTWKIPKPLLACTDDMDCLSLDSPLCSEQSKECASVICNSRLLHQDGISQR